MLSLFLPDKDRFIFEIPFFTSQNMVVVFLELYNQSSFYSDQTEAVLNDKKRGGREPVK